MDTIQFLAEHIHSNDEERCDILRAVVCILARDIRPSEERIQHAKILLQNSYVFLCAFYHLFDCKISDNAIEVYCEVFDNIDFTPPSRAAAPQNFDIDKDSYSTLFNHLVSYIKKFGDNSTKSITKTLLKYGIANDGTDFNKLLYVLQLYPNTEKIDTILKYCKITEYSNYLSSDKYGLVSFILSLSFDNNSINSKLYEKCITILQSLVHKNNSGEFLQKIIKTIIELNINKRVLTICCSIICTFFSKKSSEYLEIFRNTPDIFYMNIAKIINNGGFYDCNSPEGWCVYILLYSVMYEVKPCALIGEVIHKSDIIKVYKKTSSELKVISLMSSLIMIFSKTNDVTDYDEFIHNLMKIVDIKIYKLLIDILENTVCLRGGNGYKCRTFTLEFILTCIWRIVFIDEINYSIINSKLLNLLNNILERFYNNDKYITREHFRIVLHIFEYIIPYCITYDFADYYIVSELKKIKYTLVKIYDSDILCRRHYRSAILSSDDVEAVEEKLNEIKEVEIENSIIDYIQKIISSIIIKSNNICDFTSPAREAPPPKNFENTTVCVPYKVRYISKFCGGGAVREAPPPQNFEKEKKEIITPIAVPIKITPIIVHFGNIVL